MKNKEKKKKRSKRVINETHTYKGGMDPDELEEKEVTLKEQRSKKIRTDPGQCGCASLRVVQESAHARNIIEIV